MSTLTMRRMRMRGKPAGCPSGGSCDHYQPDIRPPDRPPDRSQIRAAVAAGWTGIVWKWTRRVRRAVGRAVVGEVTRPPVRRHPALPSDATSRMRIRTSCDCIDIHPIPDSSRTVLTSDWSLTSARPYCSAACISGHRTEHSVHSSTGWTGVDDGQQVRREERDWD